MIKSIAIYPHHIDIDYLNKIDFTLKLADMYGFDEIFTTVHLPEYSLSQQLDCFDAIVDKARKYGFDITVDIGGHFLSEVLENKEYIDKLKTAEKCFVRLDYGFDMNQVRELHNKIGNKGFVVNASIYRKEEIQKTVQDLKTLDEKLEIRACHNFYVREQTGLDEVTALRQDSYFEDLNIPVCYCIPLYSHPRAPLYKGLCTLEKHRNKSINEVLADLIINQKAEYIMLADEWPTEQEFKEFGETYDVLNMPLNEEEVIGIRLFDTASSEERNIVLKTHVFRYDSPEGFLRSQSSRQMAEVASSIKAFNTITRNRGLITIDNEKYQRYSGELQVVMCDAESDERVNVVGIIKDSNDLLKLKRFREGIKYKFTEVD